MRRARSRSVQLKIVVFVVVGAVVVVGGVVVVTALSRLPMCFKQRLPFVGVLPRAVLDRHCYRLQSRSSKHGVLPQLKPWSATGLGKTQKLRWH